MASQKEAALSVQREAKQDEKSSARFEHHEGTNRVTHELVASLTEWRFESVVEDPLCDKRNR